MAVREDRKEQILNVAVSVFSKNGYYKTTTAMIAKEAGVTQPYIFHFFKSKEELFMKVLDRAAGRIYETFSQTDAPPSELMSTMGSGFRRIIETHREEVLMVMQAHAVAEPAIREHIRAKFQFMHKHLIEKFKAAGIPDAETAVSHFFGMGFLITVAEVLDLPQLLCFE